MKLVGSHGSGGPIGRAHELWKSQADWQSWELEDESAEVAWGNWRRGFFGSDSTVRAMNKRPVLFVWAQYRVPGKPSALFLRQ